MFSNKLDHAIVINIHLYTLVCILEYLIIHFEHVWIMQIGMSFYTFILILIYYVILYIYFILIYYFVANRY